MRREAGLTLIELLITLAVLAVLAAVAVPAAGELINGTVRASTTNTLVGSIQFARSESARLGVPVTMCPSLDGRHCADDREAWRRGWLLYRHLDAGTGRVLKDESQILAVHTMSRVVGLQVNRNAFTFRMDGRRSTNGTFLLCAAPGGAAEAAVIVSVTGRPRTTRDPARIPSSACQGSSD
jgi:type IV fimbrial biogenesis protein FimT